MIMACPLWARGRGEILRKSSTRSFEAMINNPKDLARITQWIQKEGFLEQFNLSREVEEAIRKKEEKLR